MLFGVIACSTVAGFAAHGQGSTPVSGKRAESLVIRNAMVVDGARKEAFLYGNYKFKSQDGKIKLGNQGAQAGLLINFTNRDRPRVTSGADVPAASRTKFLQLIEGSK